jgi:2-polyprenyl-6-methoxyphenol hydroxylase-like FAD-dependent oxidoreductase
MAKKYDVIVVGARCAGSPVAMLLARAGQRVLLVDRASFPSDTVSTHMVHATGIEALRRWGLADELAATGCPPIRLYSFDFGQFTVAASPLPTPSGVDVAYGPRRTVLDKILVDAAAKAGTEVRENVTVQDLIVEDGRVTGIRAKESGGGLAAMTARADLVIGADGRHSMVAEATGAAAYHERPAGNVAYYAYWSGLPAPGFDVHLRPGRVVAGMPTHEGLNCLVVAAQIADMNDFRKDIEGNYLAEVRKIPEYADRLGGATRETRFVGMTTPNFYRKPHGPGWALVGDAGYDRDPCTAQGISDAFRDAELLARAWLDVRSGQRTFDDAMAGYQFARDERTLPIYEQTCERAACAPPPPEVAALLAAVAADPAASQGFISTIAGTLPVPEFFSDANIGQIMASSAR